MYNLIPYPNRLIDQGYVIENGLTVAVSYENIPETLKKYISEILAKDFNIKFVDAPSSDPKIRPLNVSVDNTIEKDGYSLEILKTSINVIGFNEQAVFYGIQTFRQILFQSFDSAAGVFKINGVLISDSPRFQWRGFMLDEARYFLGKESVKKVLDWMAFLKLNRFHWGLTNDQGWRIQIDKYPKLTEIGSKRKGTPVYRNLNKEIDGIEHGLLHKGRYQRNHRICQSALYRNCS